jgi:hypothetical protein
MAKNGAHGGGRVAKVLANSNIVSPRVGMWEKRDFLSGRFSKTKRKGGNFKGVVREK